MVSQGDIFTDILETISSTSEEDLPGKLRDIIQDHSQEGPMVTEMAVIMADLAKTAKSAQNEALKYRKEKVEAELQVIFAKEDTQFEIRLAKHDMTKALVAVVKAQADVIKAKIGTRSQFDVSTAVEVMVSAVSEAANVLMTQVEEGDSSVSSEVKSEEE